MTREEHVKDTEEILMNFLVKTAGDDCQITTSIKAIMAQFILNVRRELNKVGAERGYTVSCTELIAIQIQELRRCIVDIGNCEEELKQGVTIQ